MRNRHDPCYAAPGVGESVSAPSTFTRSVASYKNRHHQQRVTSRPRGHQTSHNSLPLACEEQGEWEEWSDQPHPDRRNSQWRAHQSGSHFSLPNLGSTSSYSTCSAPVPSSNLHNRSCSLKPRPSLVPPFRLNVESLIGAEETDVDTGDKVNPGSSADLSVVSAYIKSSLPLTPRPLSAPPEDSRPTFSPEVPGNNYKSATLGRTPNGFNCSPSTLVGTYLQSSSLSTSAAPSSSDVSINLSDSCSIISAPTEEAERVEEEQEFYI